MFYNLLYPLADVFSPFNMFRYLTFRSMRRLPDGAGAELPDRRRADPLAAQQAGAGPADPRRRPGKAISDQEGHAHHGRAADPDRADRRTLLWADLTNRYIWIVLGVTLGFGLSASGTTSSRSPSATARACRAGSSSLSQIVVAGRRLRDLRCRRRAPLRLHDGLAVSEGCAGAAGLVGFVAFAMLVMVGASNAVNLTDGLDGLAIGPVMMAAGVLWPHRLYRRQ